MRGTDAISITNWTFKNKLPNSPTLVVLILLKLYLYPERKSGEHLKENKMGQNRQGRTDMKKQTNVRTAIRTAVIGQKGPLFLVADE